MGQCGGVGCHCDGVERVDMEGGGSTRSGLRLKVVKMIFTFIFLDEEKIQVSDSVTAVHLTMFVV